VVVFGDELMVDAFEQIVCLVVVGVAEHRIRTDSANNVAIGFVIGGGVRVLVIQRVVGDEIRELHRRAMLNVADACIRVANGVVQTGIVGPSDHVVVQRANDLHTAIHGPPNELTTSEQPAFFASERRENDGGGQRAAGKNTSRFKQCCGT
jgi:hypothetical protein